MGSGMGSYRQFQSQACGELPGPAAGGQAKLFCLNGAPAGLSQLDLAIGRLQAVNLNARTQIDPLLLAGGNQRLEVSRIPQLRLLRN